jgi:hypothetical protein
MTQIVVICVSSFLLVLCGLLVFVFVGMDSWVDLVGLVVVFLARNLDVFGVDCGLSGCFFNGCVDVVNWFVDVVNWFVDVVNWFVDCLGVGV